MWKNILRWTLAIVLCLAASIYQRKTGPSMPVKASIEIDGEKYSFTLPRSGGTVDCPVQLTGLPVGCQLYLYWKHYPSDQNYTLASVISKTSTSRETGKRTCSLEASLPVQPAAGKLAYYICIKEAGSREPHIMFKDNPLIIRFKGDVAAGILIPHIILMFLSMLLAIYAGLCICFKLPQYKRWMIASTAALFLGGFIFGPLVQHSAFGIYWSGFPFGGDLTDNKTLIALIFMLIAVFTHKWKHNRLISIAAVIVMMAIFTIPHSTRGSELNRESGTIESAK